MGYSLDVPIIKLLQKGKIMDKMIVIVFTNETNAFNGLTELKNLHRNGDITLYNEMVISKDDRGEISTKDIKDDGPIGTFMGMSVGALLGMFGGPVGMLAGMSGGALAGMFYDINEADIDIEFVDEVSKKMVPGTVAILADVNEEWTTPIDSKMVESGGVVFRQLRRDVEDNQIEQRINKEQESIEKFKKELQASKDDAKDKINEHINKAKENLVSLSERAKKKEESLKEDMQRKIETLEGQVKDLDQKNRDKINQMIERVKTEYNTKIDKLHRAFEAAKVELDS